MSNMFVDTIKVFIL